MKQHWSILFPLPSFLSFCHAEKESSKSKAETAGGQGQDAGRYPHSAVHRRADPRTQEFIPFSGPSSPSPLAFWASLNLQWLFFSSHGCRSYFWALYVLCKFTQAQRKLCKKPKKKKICMHESIGGTRYNFICAIYLTNGKSIHHLRIPVLKGPHNALHLHMNHFSEHASSQPTSPSRGTQLHLHTLHAGELRPWALGCSPVVLLRTMVSVIGPFRMHMRKEACGFQRTTLLFLIYPNVTDC